MRHFSRELFAPPDGSATIICVHGAIVNGWEMIVLRRRLQRLGYRVRQFYYRSMTRSLADNVAALRDFVAATEGQTVHLVGHSMGGVLIRRLFEQAPDPRPGRLLAIGSPLRDCWIGHAGRRRGRQIGDWFIGRTVADHIDNPVEPVWHGTRDFAVIAGTFPLGVGTTFRAIPRPHDGVILWRETWLAGLSDHATYRINHFGMLLSRRCLVQIAHFLAFGHFRGDSGTATSGRLASSFTHHSNALAGSASSLEAQRSPCLKNTAFSLSRVLEHEIEVADDQFVTHCHVAVG